MKKAYVKPAIMFESFSLSTNIAGDCEKIIDNQNRGNCGMEFGDITVFISEYTGCSTNDGVTIDVGGDDGSYNGLCYHVPFDTKNLFNS